MGVILIYIGRTHHPQYIKASSPHTHTLLEMSPQNIDVKTEKYKIFAMLRQPTTRDINKDLRNVFVIISKHNSANQSTNQ